MTRLRAARDRATSVGVLLCLLAASPAVAQTQPRSPRLVQAPPPEPRFGLRGYALFGTATLAAKETLDAVADTHSRATFGGGAQVTNIWRSVFVDVSAAQLTLDGERVFVDNRQVFKLGIPLQIKMRSVDVAGGWRFTLMRRIFPYAGAGFTYLQYEESSSFAQTGEDVSEGKAGPLLLGGVDIRVWRWISAGTELRWRRVRGILGEGGASAEFGEDDAGGVNVAMRISVGR